MKVASGLTPRLRVLLVDDHVDTCTVLAGLLENLGYDVRIAHTGEDALRHALEFLPALVVVDVELPGMSGYELAPRIRASEGLEHAHIVAMTGHASARYRERALGAGMDECLFKPFSVRTLVAAFEQRRPSIA